MHREGHFGLAMLFYAPVLFVLLERRLFALAVVGAAVMNFTASLPDIDQRIPFISHRGITHTVWFALAVAAGFGLAGYGLGTLDLPLIAVTPITLGVTAATVALVTLSSHLLGDMLTPAGVKPIAPVADKKISLSLFLAKSPVANYGLLFAGFVSLGFVLAAVSGVLDLPVWR